MAYGDVPAKGNQLKAAMKKEVEDRYKGDQPESLAELLCSLAARVQSLESAIAERNLGERTADALDAQSLKVGGVDVKTVQSAVDLSGSTVKTLTRIRQDENGNVTPTFGNIRSATPSQNGIVQLAGSIGATVASENNKAASEKAVRDAINAIAPDADVYVATYSDTSAAEFGLMKTALASGKKIYVTIGESNTDLSLIAAVRIPLTKCVYSGSTITDFYFEYVTDDFATEVVAGEIIQIYCNSSGWGSRSLQVYSATVAQIAGTASNANITRTADASNGDVLQIGTGTSVNVVNAKNAMNDSIGGSIKDIYICDLKKVNTATESGYVFSGFSVKNDDSSLGNRKYIEALYSAFPHPKMFFLPIPVQDSTTSDNVHLEDVNGGYYSVACHKDAEHSTIITDTFTAIGYGVFDIDFDYRILRESSSSTRVGLKFALCALSNAGTSSPTKKVSVNDTTIFASATESFDGSTSAWFGGHVHMIGDISNASGSFASSKSVALLAGFTLGEIKVGGGYNTGYLVTDNITVKAYNKHL